MAIKIQKLIIKEMDYKWGVARSIYKNVGRRRQDFDEDDGRIAKYTVQ